MAMTYRDVSILEGQLLAVASNASVDDREVLREAHEWFAAEGACTTVNGETVATLCECMRAEYGGDVRLLAKGALLVARDSPEDACLVTRYALMRIAELSGMRALWTGVPLPPEDTEKAMGLFASRHPGPEFDDEHLIDSGLDFMERFDRSSDLFGRVSADVGFLCETLEDEGSSESVRDCARRGLGYLKVVADAIPDDLGLVGYLDDALVIRKAVEEIEPRRAALNDVLDASISRWPFLKDLAFEHASDRHELDEFCLINTALAMNPNPIRFEGSRDPQSSSGNPVPCP